MDVDAAPSADVERKASHAHLVLPGEVITEEPTSMRGHGTYLLDGKIVASVAGIVERIGKLVSVRTLRSRYVLCFSWESYCVLVSGRFWISFVVCPFPQF